MSQTTASRMYVNNAGIALFVIAMDGRPVYSYSHMYAEDAVRDLRSFLDHGWIGESGEIDEWVEQICANMSWRGEDPDRDEALMNIWNASDPASRETELVAEAWGDGTIKIYGRGGFMGQEIVRLLEEDDMDRPDEN